MHKLLHFLGSKKSFLGVRPNWKYGMAFPPFLPLLYPPFTRFRAFLRVFALAAR